VVKYRKQLKYKSFPFYNTTQSDVSFNYSYIDSLASNSKYVYDVTTETTLKTALNAIAADVKSWAGYEDAKNVD
jgi:hypothetical protein